jgi:hypothetical protein
MPPIGVVSLCSPSSSAEAEIGAASRVVNRIDNIRELLNLCIEGLLSLFGEAVFEEAVLLI